MTKKVHHLNAPDMKTAIIYARVSSTTDRQNTDRQTTDLIALAKANELKVEKVFTEHISGAKRNKEREVLISSLDYAKTNHIDVILFSELSRLGRNVLEVLEVVKWMSDNSVNAYFQKESLYILDGKGKVAPTTTILISCLAMVAEIERENIKFRLNSGREQAKRKGIKMGRKTGSVETITDKQAKYPNAIKLLRKGGYKMTEIIAICESKGEKISLATLKRLKSVVE